LFSDDDAMMIIAAAEERERAQNLMQVATRGTAPVFTHN
jgi:hypothetical protein